MVRTINRSTPQTRREEGKQRLLGFQSVYERVNSILVGETVRTRFVPAPTQQLAGIAAWSSGTSVFLNETLILDRYVNLPWDTIDEDRELHRFMASLTGANYHEVCHILFSIRATEKFIQDLFKRGKQRPSVWAAYQMLEDQRIEAMFWATYPPVESYFRYMVAQWVVTQGTILDTAHMLLYGRRYLDGSFRQTVRDTFINAYGINLAEDVEDIVMSYMALRKSDGPSALKLINRFADILEQIAPRREGQPCGHQSPEGASVFKRGTVDQKRSKDAKAEAMEVIEAVDIEDAEEGYETGGNYGEAEEGDDGDSEGGVGNGTGDQKPNEDVDTTQAAPIDFRGAGSGLGTKETSKGTPADIRAEAERMVEDILNDADFVRDVKETFIAARKAFQKEEHASTVDYLKFTNDTPSDGAVVASRRAREALKQLRVDLEPVWIPRQDEGRLDANAFSQRHDAADLNVMRRWDEGAEEEARLEMVILLDQSFSMSSMMRQASEALWIVKTMMDDQGLPCTVFGFSTEWGLLYRAHERAATTQCRVFMSYSDTNPYNAIKEAQEVVARSNEKHQAVVLITDGQFSGGQSARSDAALEDLGRAGVMTAILGLRSAVSNYGTHKCRMGMDVSDPMGVARFCQRLVAEVMRQARNFR